MQLMQVTFGLATAAQVSFYSYIYQLVSQDDYQRVVSLFLSGVLSFLPSSPSFAFFFPQTGFTRASTLMGPVIAGVLGECGACQFVF